MICCFPLFPVIWCVRDIESDTAHRKGKLVSTGNVRLYPCLENQKMVFLIVGGPLYRQKLTWVQIL